MIVEPDFLTHWKTQMLINELGDKAAPVYVIALWAHCQQRRSDSFSNLAPSALKAICRYEGEASKLRSALERCGFIDVQGDALVVHGWGETNAKLIANWTNGPKGGRPRKPNDNPNLVSDNPEGTDKRRGDKIPKHTHSHARPESVAEALEYANGKAGYAPEIVRHWFSQRDSQNWQKGNAHPVTNWRSDLDAWVLNQRNHQPNGQKPRRSEADRDRENTGLNEDIKIKEL